MPFRTFFAARNTGTGSELWITDGTSAGTTFVKDIRPGTSGSYPGGFAAAGNNVVFVANDGTHGNELWVSDGTAADTTLLDDINPGSTASSPNGLTTLGSKVVFSANDGVHGPELWVTDGTSAGTSILKDIAPGATGSYPIHLALFGSVALFDAKGSDGIGLWQTDGTAAGTKEIKTIYPNGFVSGSAFTVAGGKAFFAATDGSSGSAHGTELWATDGTAAGTGIVFDINPGTAGSNPAEITALGSKVVFRATDTTHGTELWASDGTSAGTTLLKDINAGTANGYPKYLTSIGTHVLFFATSGNDSNQLWTTDGTASGTTFIEDVNGYGKMVALNGRAYFAGNDGVHGNELWVSDGTVAGTGELKDLFPGKTGSYPSGLALAGNHILFTAEDTSLNSGLWTTDGTAAGTYEISSAPAGPSNFFTTSTPACFAEGSLILTARGEVPVERLAVGDLVHAWGSADPVPIIWIGRSRVDPARHSRPWDVHPVRVRAGAFAKGLPRRDLLLSPEHAVYADGVLIPIRHMVNETTIVQQPGGPVVYWHVELPAHAVIFAEGLPAESYRDTGNRGSFDNAAAVALHANFGQGAVNAPAFAPIIESGPLLAALHAKLAARGRRRQPAAAAALKVKIRAPGPLRAAIPAGVSSLHLVCPAYRPPGDQRRLGAAIAGLAIDGVPLPLVAACIAAGFHGVETGTGRWRWTDGKGVILLTPSDRARILTIDVVALAAPPAAAAAA